MKNLLGALLLALPLLIILALLIAHMGWRDALGLFGSAVAFAAFTLIAVYGGLALLGS